MIYKKITKTDFIEEFHKFNRQDNFTFRGLEMLYLILSQCDVDYELDVIAICCDWSESSKQEIMKEYDYLFDDYIDEGDIIQVLSDHTQVYQLENENILYKAF